MATQARAEATRTRILDAAVELFDEVGYGETSLSDLVTRSGVTKGALYYHFQTRESVATAIIEEGESRIRQASLAVTSRTAPTLQNLIRSYFAVAEAAQRDRLTRIGNLLRQALTQISPISPATYAQRRDVLVAMVKSAIGEGDLIDDLDPDEVAHTILAIGLGNRLLADATGEDVFLRLGQAWRVMVRQLVPADVAPDYLQFVNGLVDEYTPAG